MNAYAVLILLALLVDFVLHSVADMLNVRALNGALPEAVEPLYRGEEHQRAKDYVRTVTLAGCVERSVGLLALLAFWFLGGFGWLDGVVRQSLSSELARGLAYIGALALAYTALDVPFDAHRTFVIEARFGFNRTTWRTFVADRLKGVVIGALIGGALLSAVLLLFLRAGGDAWLLCWLAVVVFSVVTQWLAPALILPLFNKFEPMPEGELRNSILSYARSVDFPVQNLYVIDGSRRSSKANAYFTGLGRKRRIALFDTLIARYSIAEVVAVLAHEVGHYKRRHVMKGMLLSAAHAGLALFLLDYFIGRPGLYEAFSFAQPSLYAGLVGFALLYTPVEFLLSVLVNRVSRGHEFEADRYAVATAPEPSGLATALQTLSVTSLAHPNPHSFYVALNYSHPPLARRLRAIETCLHERGAAAQLRGRS
jgi:STE24 endopeptidase